MTEVAANGSNHTSSSQQSHFVILLSGPFRTIQPPIEIEEMDVDVCLLSHTHYDHLDISSARRIGNRALW